ncbi:MAG: hypothetical protein HYR55_03670 [Acidobacteria bacterium]|nr:hypothetical protein [Acidobacteriota bacterium]MBI3658681.1 hypothetical protein [Acidobacteriota bacterium]
MHEKAITSADIRAAGWEALVQSLGLTNATRFILQYEPGAGDYLQIKEQLFGRKTVDALYSAMVSKRRKNRKR